MMNDSPTRHGSPPEGAELEELLSETRMRIGHVIRSDRRPRKLRYSLAASVAAIACVTGGAAIANAGPFAQTDSKIVRDQESLESIVARIRTFQDREGYGGVAIDVAAGSVTVWWKGTVDPALQRIVDEPGEFRIKVLPAKFTRSELVAAGNRIAGKRSGDGSYEVRTIILENRDRPTYEYGLIAQVKLHDGRSAQSVAIELSDIAGLPVTVTEESSVPL